MNDQQMLTRRQCAERCSVSAKTIDRAIRRGMDTGGKDGLYPIARFGSSVRIPSSSLDKWLSASLIQ